MSSHKSHARLSRRTMLKGSVAAAAGAAMLNPRVRADEIDPNWKIEKGRIKQSVVSWCFNPMKVEDLADASAKMGLKSVELCDPKFWPALKALGLTCAIAGSHGFVKGFNHPENHDECVAKVLKSIDASADFGCPSVICFSGMKTLNTAGHVVEDKRLFKEGMTEKIVSEISDEDGMKNTINGLKKVVGAAEKKKVTLCIEVLNSRVAETMKGHPGYQADKLEWAVQVCDKIGSPNMKILFDIYHIQIMEGDVIVRIKKYKDYIGHYHTAGVPGRCELDDTQEINYPPIIRAIIDTGYTGFLGQEFIPRNKDVIASLRQGVRVCDV
ncbi:MAG TPA: TIM barrel protein [Planctomycetota bacterium]|nr:TIM barrel protein [Planctomycetota bacterium]